MAGGNSSSGSLVYRMEMLGNERMIKLLLQAGPAAVPALARGLYEEGQVAFRNSQKEVPYRKGILKGSGRLHEPQIMGDNVVVRISYGGAAMKYAAAVHELDKNYNKGKKRHYLIDPVNARVSLLGASLAKRVARIIGEASA